MVQLIADAEVGRSTEYLLLEQLLNFVAQGYGGGSKP
jgi:hypothetical protein